jgi:predicted CXXCH cytochrome family protein
VRRLKSEDPQVEIEACAPCHSRRQAFHPEDPPAHGYYDCYSNELLLPSTYYADGQVLDEVYEYGSFIQSKMYHERVRCTDCHNPHTTRLKLDGNSLCTSCHTHHSPAKYDTPAHHRHTAGSAGAQCVECHMPATPYMDIDFRRDHSLRVPRPDLSVELDTPNACTGCHLKPENVDAELRPRLKHYSDWLLAAREGNAQARGELDRVNRWAADWIKTWYGPKERPRHFAHTLAAAWRHDPLAVPGLAELAGDRRQPAIVRASALVQLAQLAPQKSVEAASDLLDDAHPQVRSAAIGCLETLPPRDRLRTLTPMLEDSVRLVRADAARALAPYPPEAFSQRYLQLRDRALQEYRAGLLEHADQASAHVGLGHLADSQADATTALREYRTAISVQPEVVGPRSNLAELLERTGDPRHAPEVALLRREELELAARDARLAPQSPVTQYRYGLSLYLLGQFEQAEVALQAACRLEPQLPDYRLTLTLFYQRLERWDDALLNAAELCQLRPQDLSYQNLLREIQAQAKASGSEGGFE